MLTFIPNHPPGYTFIQVPDICDHAVAQEDVY